MSKYDDPVNPVERTQALAAFQAAEKVLTEQVAAMQGQFTWERSADFYAGYAKGLLVAMYLWKDNQGDDRAFLGGLLLLQAGLVLKHQLDEAEKG